MSANRSFAIVATLVLGLAWSGCSEENDPTPPVTTGALEGTITRVESELPVSDVGVVLVAPAGLMAVAAGTVTDTDGRYVIDNIPAGDYALFIFSDSLLVFDRTAPAVGIIAGSTTLHDVGLMRSAFWDGSGYRIEGTILDAATAQPVSGAWVAVNTWALDGADVRLLFEGLFMPDWALSAADGTFSITSGLMTDFEGNPLGLWPITITRDGYQPLSLVGEGVDQLGIFGAPLPLPVEPDTVLIVAPRLTREESASPAMTGALRGRVTTLDGAPVPDLPVALSLLLTASPDTVRSGGPRPTPVQGRVATTGADGSFLIAALAPGTYVLAPAFEADDGYLTASLESGWITVTEADTVDVGDALVLPAIDPVSPATGATISAATPELVWAAVSGATAYRVELGTGHIFELVAEPTAARWQVPAEMAFEPGDHVRWFITARGEVGGRTTRIASFEVAATFQVATPMPRTSGMAGPPRR